MASVDLISFYRTVISIWPVPQGAESTMSVTCSQHSTDTRYTLSCSV